MLKLQIFTLLLILSGSAIAQNPNPSSSTDNYILSEMAAEHAAGMSTLIVKDGEVVWVNSYGFSDVENNVSATDSTVFLLASISKVFTGTALMHLHQNGHFNLDEDINNYLPFDIEIPNYLADSITFRMLMTHSSSILDNDAAMETYYSNGDPTIALGDVVERYFSTSGADYNSNLNFSNNSPGTVYEYSNMATALAGYMVEAVSGTDFSDYCNTHIFDKLCMNSTSWYLADFDTNNMAQPYQWLGGQYVPYAHYGFADYPNGQLRSTSLDLANFLIAYLQNGAFNSQELLSATSINEMLSPQIPFIDPTQGLNWYLEDIYLNAGGTVPLWGHNGGENGVSTDMYIDQTNNIGVLVISNGEGDNLNIVDELYNYALTLSPTGLGNPPCDALSIEHLSKPSFFLYPNPSVGLIHIDLDQMTEDFNLVLYNSVGKLLHSETLRKSQNFSYQLPETDGLYIIQLIDSEGSITTLKVVKE